jgi:hypothetical protein
MSFLGKLVSGTIKAACTPIAIVRDVADVAQGKNPKSTKKLIDSSLEDIEDAFTGDY